MTVDFRRALARLVPVFMPELLFRLAGTVSRVSGICGGNPADRIPAGQNIRLRRDDADRLLVALAEVGSVTGQPRSCDHQDQELANTFRFHIPQYLMRRAADWKARDLPRR